MPFVAGGCEGGPGRWWWVAPVDRCQRCARGTNPEEREEGEGWAVGGGALAGRSIKTGDGDRDPMGHSVPGTAGAPGPVIDKVGFEGVTLHWGIAGNRSAPGGPHPLCFPGNTTRSWVFGGGRGAQGGGDSM